MPEMRFVIAWPDAQEEACYSPSLVIRDFFEEGGTYPVSEFVSRSRQALTIASDRVKARYGFPCSLALGQLARIENRAAAFEQPDACVEVRRFIL